MMAPALLLLLLLAPLSVNGEGQRRRATSAARLPFILGPRTKLGPLQAARVGTGPTLPPTTRRRPTAAPGKSLNRRGGHSSRPPRVGSGSVWSCQMN